MCIYQMTFHRNLIDKKSHGGAGAYVAELPRQHAQLVDGIEGHHGHGGHGQTQPHHVGPRRENVGAVDRGVEGGKAHHHHKLQERIPDHHLKQLHDNILCNFSLHFWSHQEEAGADKLPAQPPVPSRPLANHLLDVIAESVHP